MFTQTTVNDRTIRGGEHAMHKIPAFSLFLMQYPRDLDREHSRHSPDVARPGLGILATGQCISASYASQDTTGPGAEHFPRTPLPDECISHCPNDVVSDRQVTCLIHYFHA